MTNEDQFTNGQANNGFSRADLLWSMFAKELDTTQRDQLAISLGFDIEVPAQEIEDQKRPVSATAQIPDNDNHIEDLHSSEDASDNQDEPQTIATHAAYYRITDRQAQEQQEGSSSEELNQLPAWFTQAKPTILTETKTRIPSCHRIVPLHTELTRWSRLEPFLKKILGAKRQGSQVDEQALVKQAASGQSIKRIPRKQRHHWSEMIRVLIDIDDSNFPYRRDFIHLREKLIQACGAEGLQVQYIQDEPGSYVRRYELNREIIEPWAVPEKDVPLLILSDLGMHSKARTKLYAWLVFGQLLKAQGIRPIVLMPVAKRDIDKRLLQYFDCFIWDGTSDLKRVKGAYRAEKDQRDHADSIQALLSYFFASVRVDSGLLRAVRYLLPGEMNNDAVTQHQPFDIGHETAIWRHTATVHDGDEWGWQIGSKDTYQQQAVKLLKALQPAKRSKLLGLIGRYHSMLPDELYFEAMHNFILLEALDEEGDLAGLMPKTVREATEHFMQDLVKTYAENPDNCLLDSWVKRHLAKYQGEALRKQHAYWLPFMAFAHVHEEMQKGKAVSEYPDFLDDEDIAELHRFSSYTKVARQYQLRQQGEKLVLVDPVANKKDDDWGQEFTVGALLINLTLNSNRLFHVHTDDKNNRKIVSLNLDNLQAGFEFPATGEHQFQIGQEKFTVDVSTAQQQKQPWMRFMGSGSEGLYAESQTLEGDIYRWYWHPPEWNKEKGLLPGIWYGDKVLEKVQRDTYGVYVDIHIQNILHRLRWIEPTSFQMGSPENEEGRYDDEIQHEVILTHGYWLAETTCTQALWQTVMNRNPSDFKGENKPVENVSWDDVQQFIHKVNQHNPELQLRLPTEAEWENACRAGTTGAFNFEEKLTLDKVNYRGTWDDYDKYGEGALQQTSEVKSYPANVWGLYEMHGNVLEWCEDWYGTYPAEQVVDPQGAASGTSRVFRGGSWFCLGRHCRSAYRLHGSPDVRNRSIGFRLARGQQSSPVRSVRAGQQLDGTHATIVREAQPGDGQRASDLPQRQTKPAKKSVLDSYGGTRFATSYHCYS